MLLFRGEEHVRRWCTQWALPHGAALSMETAWRLASAWFSADRGAPAWRRSTVDETEHLFVTLGLTDPFWSVRSPV